MVHRIHVCLVLTWAELTEWCWRRRKRKTNSDNQRGIREAIRIWIEIDTQMANYDNVEWGMSPGWPGWFDNKSRNNGELWWPFALPQVHSKNANECSRERLISTSNGFHLLLNHYSFFIFHIITHFSFFISLLIFQVLLMAG